MIEGGKANDPGKLRQFFLALVGKSRDFQKNAFDSERRILDNCVAANIATMSYGTMVGWPSPAIPQLQNANPPVGTEPMTDETASWLSGIMCLAGALVTLVVGAIAERLGRKVTGCLAAVPLCASWLLIIFATEHTHLLISRFLGGTGAAMILFVVPGYVSDISCDSIRGMLGSLLIFVLNGGILLIYILGACVSFRVSAIFALALPLLYLVCFLFAPESPVDLVRRNRLDQAARQAMY